MTALAGRTAAVTGASSGIGLATARRLHHLGAGVTAYARRREVMEAELPAAVAARALDVTDAGAVRAAFASTERLDVLVLAAGTNVPGRALDALIPEDFATLTATNLTGVFACVPPRSPPCARPTGS